MPSTYGRDNSPRRRSRSPEPYRELRHRSRSPRRHKHHHSHRHERERHHHRAPPSAALNAALPYKAKKLSKHQFEEYKPLFQSYLDIQKHLNLDELDERETRGRWKSFVSHWNRGELARSWYDPSMLQTAKDMVASYRKELPPLRTRGSPIYDAPPERNDGDANDESEDDFGPAAPREVASRKTGPTMPRMDDLALRDELNQEERMRQGLDYRDDIRYERKLEHKAQRQRLDELVPRADAGSRERQLEKKREMTSTLQDFRKAKEGGDLEVPEADLMGTDDLDVYKRKKMEMEKQKSEREIRREEIARARAEEREERLAEIRKKEASTMDYLKQLAKERFG